MKKKNNNLIYSFMFLMLLGIGVGYAILQANLQINGTTKIANNTWDIHFNHIQVNSESVSIGDSDSAATIDSNNNCKVDFSVTLNVPGDFYEFTVDVVNAGTIDGMIGTLTKTLKVDGVVVENVPSYLNYTITYEDGSEILSNHLLSKNTQETYKIRVEYKSDIDELPDATTISTTVEVQYVQADDTAVKKKPYNPCTYDGELVQGAEYTNGQYTYRYMQESNGSGWSNISTDGWGVILTDKDSTDPVTSKLCTSINDKPIVSMKYMFNNSKTPSIDTSSFDTSNVVNMYGMFWECSSLTDMDVSNFETSNVKNMYSMFNRCTNLKALNLGDFDTSNVTNMSAMFFNCRNLTDIDVSTFNTNSVTDMTAMFSECISLTSLNLSSFDTSNVTNMYEMFSDCSSLTSLNISSFDTSNVTNMYKMFSDCSSLTSIDVSNFDTSKVTSMQGMFANCSSLTELDLSGFDLRGASSFQEIANGIFSNTSSLNKINLSNMKLPVDMMHGIFRYGSAGSSPIEEIDVTGWNLSNTTNALGMLGANGSNGLGGTGLKRIIGLDTWDTSHITNMSQLFQGLSSLTSLDLSSFDTSNVTNTDDMFKDCTSVTTAYGRTNSDITKLNASSNKPSNITFVPKS